MVKDREFLRGLWQVVADLFTWVVIFGLIYGLGVTVGFYN